MQKDFWNFVRQCELCQANKERNTQPACDTQTLPFPSEIFANYDIDFIGPFTKLKGPDSVLVVVDRAVGFCWLIPTSVTATAVQTTELLRHHIFSPHGVPTSIVSDADPRFSSKFWKRTLKTMGIEHIMAVPGHHQTNGQAERKIRELKTALRKSPTSAKPIGSPPSLQWRHILTLATLILSTCPYTKRCMVETTPS